MAKKRIADVLVGTFALASANRVYGLVMDAATGFGFFMLRAVLSVEAIKSFLLSSQTIAP
jgi:hypothetical protein